MRTAKLTRIMSGDEGTFGTIVTDSGFTCETGELPWRDNEPGKSCIPPGDYTVVWGTSPKRGECYHVRDVPGRTDIEIHAANFMGDVDKGFQCQLEGCIAPGLSHGSLDGQKAVLHSQDALAKLEFDLGQETFQLTIV